MLSSNPRQNRRNRSGDKRTGEPVYLSLIHISLVKKTEKIRVFEPEKNPAADAWKFDYRLYYDLLVRASFEESIYTYVY